MVEVYENNKYESLVTRFKDKAELLHRLTLIDLRVFTAFITLEIAVGSWFAKSDNTISDPRDKVGLLIINFVLAIIAILILRNNYCRRKEATGTIINCCTALGYKKTGVYLKNSKLDVKTTFRPWFHLYYIGIAAVFVGVALIIL